MQAAYERNGQSTYPANARRARKIEIGKPHQLRFAIRGTLVNVWLDDEFMLAFRYPNRADGFLSLSGFDATVAFDSIEVRSLSPEIQLQEAEGPAPPTDVELAVSLAEAKLKQAKAHHASFDATWRADRAKFVDRASEQTIDQLSRRAAGLQAELEIAEAETEKIEKCF